MQIQDQEWFFKSTQTLNLNMYDQNSAVLKELQNKHTAMFNKLQQTHTDIRNSLGRMQDDIRDNRRDILKGQESIKTDIDKTCGKNKKRKNGG